VLSSKGDSKSEARYAGRLDVLTERVDTLAATVATTASAMARKDGEIASLKRELDARDKALEALAARIQSAPGAVDGGELAHLREAVAALTADGSRRASGAKQVDELTAKVGLLAEHLETLSTTVSTTAAGLAGREGELAAIRQRLESGPTGTSAPAGPDPEIVARLDAFAAELAAQRTLVESNDGEPQPNDELRAMLTTLRAHVESLDGLRGGVTEEQLEERLAALHSGATEERLQERLAATDGSLSRLAERLELLSQKVDHATGDLERREQELAVVHREFLESSSRVETIVDDLREALGAFPDTGPDVLVALGSRLDSTNADAASLAKRVEHLENAPPDDGAGQLGDRLDLLERRVSTLTEEIGRAKTLWPVALRSLEARLDDVARHQDEHAAEAPGPAPDGDDHEDLLAGLRDSLQAMESVAAELTKAAGARPDGTPPVGDATAAPAVEDEEPHDVQEAVGGGARIVPLRQADS
jgi:DNA-binding FrmR family transcriptional regulator